jgi:iron complex outermembrane receptor protein
LKTRQSLQDVPASVTALTADDLASSGLVNSADLQQKVPGLSLSSGGRETNLAIRGVSNNVRSIGADPSNAVHLDGVYLPRSSMALTELFDLQRVEVLKGPEGTLYGRNATGGAINVVTRAPTAKPGAEGFVGSGSLGLRRTQVAVGGGTDDVSGRLAVAYTKDDGYTRNLSTGTGLDDNNFKAFRGKLRVALGGKSDLTLMAQASEDKGTIGYGVSTDTAITGPQYPYSLGYGLTGADHRTNARNIRLDSPVTSSRKTSVMAATVNWDLGSVGFKSITGNTSYKSGDQNDVDWTGAKRETQDTTTDVKSTSQEFQLYSQGDGPLEWTAGVFLYRDKGTETLDWLFHAPLSVYCGSPVSCAWARQTVKSSGRSEAVFGQMTYRFTREWSGLLGARYNRDSKDGDATNRKSGANSITDVSFTSFTPKAQLQWTPAKGLMAYAGVSKGFKSGGFNYGSAGLEKFEPESIVATEVGVRSTLMGGALSLNASAFNYDYTDLQLKTAVLSGSRFISRVTNASKAKVQGLELSADMALGSGFGGGLSAAFIDSELLSYVSPATERELSGMPLPLTPKSSGSVWLDHKVAVAGGQLRSHLEYNYRSSVVFPLTLDQANNKGEAYGVVNASLRWTAPRDAWYMQAGVRNATDKLYRTMRADYPDGGVVESFGAPRTVEFRLGFKY